MRLRVFTITAILLALLLVSCASQTLNTPIPNANGADETGNVATPAMETGNPETGYFAPQNGSSPAEGYLPPQSDLVPDAPKDAPVPQPGKAAISGSLVLLNSGSALPGVAFYLTPAVGDLKNEVPPLLLGPNPNSGDVVGLSDEKGNFRLDNIPPGNYFLVINFFNSLPLAQSTTEDATPLFIMLNEGQSLALGAVYVPEN